MATICKTEGIVIRGTRFMESSRIVSLYTRKFGKVRAVAKGIRRPKSRFGSALEPFTVSNIVFYRREGKDLHTVSEADIVKEHAPLREDLQRMGAASVITDFLEAANPEESENTRLYALSVSMLDSLETFSLPQLDLILWTFLVRAATMLGYGPVVESCAVCRSDKIRVGFSPSLGGAVCANCSRGNEDVRRISPDSLELLMRLVREGEKNLAEEEPSPEQAAEITEALKAHLLYHTERRMKSFDFRKSLK